MDVAYLAVDDLRGDVAHHVARDPTDQGGVVDAVSMVVDVAGDVVRDVATAIVDAEVRDAHAGGDAGADAGVPPVRACDCVPPTDNASFSAAVDFQGRSLTPEGTYSTASGSVTPRRRDRTGVEKFVVRGTATFYIEGDYQVIVTCNVDVRRDGTIVRVEGPTSGEFHDGRCSVRVSPPMNPLPVADEDVPVDGIRVVGLTDSSFELQVPSVAAGLRTSGSCPCVDAGVAGIRNLVIRVSHPAGGYLTPPNAYRP